MVCPGSKLEAPLVGRALNKFINDQGLNANAPTKAIFAGKDLAVPEQRQGIVAGLYAAAEKSNSKDLSTKYDTLARKLEGKESAPAGEVVVDPTVSQEPNARTTSQPNNETENGTQERNATQEPVADEQSKTKKAAEDADSNVDPRYISEALLPNKAPAFKGNPLSAKITELMLQGASFNAVLDALIPTLKGPAQRLMRKIRSQNLTPTIEVAPTETGTSGYYNPSTNTIGLNPENGLTEARSCTRQCTLR